jgi:dienelactone hydrolase
VRPRRCAETQGRGAGARRAPLPGPSRALAVCVLIALSVTAVAAPPAPEEAKQRAKAAQVFVEAGTWLKDRGRKAEAQRAVVEAREADPKAAGLDALGVAVEALEAKEGGDTEAAKRWQKAAEDAAKVYEKLGTLDHDPKDDARFDGYLAKALELDPSKARLAKVLGLVRQAAGNQGRAVSVGRLLVRLRELDPDPAAAKKYDALEADLAKSDVALVKSPEHPMVAWLSLPKAWAPKGEWGVLVAVDGAGANFLGACRHFAGARGSRRFLVVAPCSLSNTNELKPETYPFYSAKTLEEGNANRVDFDNAGLDAILRMLKERYGAADKIAITGFSGGGNLCYSWTMRKPDRVLACAPACANFNPGLPGDAVPVEGGGPPVHILTGEKDQHREHVFGNPPGIEGQSDQAQEAFGRLGFTRVKRTMLPGVGHSSCVAQVWAFVDEVGAGK